MFINKFQALNHIDTLLILGNNIPGMKITNNDKFHMQVKHINIQYHFIKELIEQKKISIDYINTK